MNLKPGIEAVRKLAHLGYRFTVSGETIKARYEGPGDPDPAQVRPLLALVKEHKTEVLALLKAQDQTPQQPPACHDCAHFREADSPNSAQAWGYCRKLRRGRYGCAAPCDRFTRRQAPERIISCAECPWHRENPWTHYPELPAWCDWHFNYLAADNPTCIGYRRGEVPETGPAHLTGRPRSGDKERGKIPMRSRDQRSDGHE